MSIRVLEDVRDELIRAGLVSNTSEFCISWLGKSDCYIRTLRHNRLNASADVNRPQFAGGSKVSMDGAYGKK